MNWPKISIITPSYNQGGFIEETILSVLNQNYSNFEHIIIDGGSTDNTLEILKKYPHLIWVSEPDRGQSDAINKGLKKTKGDIIAWLNSDDFYEPDVFLVVAEIIKEDKDIHMVYGNCNFIYEENNGKKVCVKYIPSQFSFKKLLGCGYNYIPQPTTFFRREVFDKIGLLNMELNYCMDHELFIRIALALFNIKKIDKVIANYRKHIDSKTVSQGLQMRKESFIICKKYGGDGIVLRFNYLLARIVYSNPFVIRTLRKIKRKLFKIIYG